MATLLKPRRLPKAATSAPATLSPEQSWPGAWASPEFRGRLGLVGLGLLGLLEAAPRYFHFIQSRPGRLLDDPLLSLLPVHDESTLTFALIYGSIGATLAFLLPRPQLLLRAFWAYFILQLLRMLTLWLLPLDPPVALVALHDPVVDHLFAATTQPVVRDLFFSGHTATMALLALAVRGRRWRWPLVVLTGAVGMLVLVQRVHYSYDVLAAPLFAWLAYWLAERVAWQRPPYKYFS
ncbi:phosphatase PAP2-related protein [Hymenobacter sedentarius]|uniref:phosphatase PAP2-related protein n=1 Tax=Hymenobacter sedentarius TaxID=1411621 RepID=UPI0012FD4B14|nr:phosphatase PAP2-related protein [Hymenobacter sedentarius]